MFCNDRNICSLIWKLLFRNIFYSQSPFFVENFWAKIYMKRLIWNIWNGGISLFMFLFIGDKILDLWFATASKNLSMCSSILSIWFRIKKNDIILWLFIWILTYISQNHQIGKYYNCNKYDSSAFELEKVEYSISTEINCISYNLYTVLQFNRIAHLYVILILIRNIGSFAQFIYWLIIFVECTNRKLYSYSWRSVNGFLIAT